MAALTYFPKSRLSELVTRFGGLSRNDAVEAAKQQLESMRGESDTVIGAAITQLEAIAYAPENSGRYADAQLQEMLCLGDQIVTLAGTFSHPALDKATRSLCDVTDGMLRVKRSDAASIQVHVRAMRLVAPGSTPLSPEQIAKMLSELAKILAHYGFSELSASAGGDSEDDAIAKKAEG